MENRITASAMALSMALCVSAPASAAVTLLTNPNQISTTYLNTFETTVNSGPVTFTDGEIFSAAGATRGVTPSGTQGLAIFPPDSIEAALSSSFTAVGLFFGNDDTCCSAGYSGILEVFSGATSLGSVSLPANMNDFADQFIGLSSTAAFDRVVYKSGAGGDELAIYIDDFRLGSAAVAAAAPEPSTWAMLLLGFGVIGTALRRRRKKSIDLQFAL